MKQDYSGLRKKIRGVYVNLDDFAKDLGITAGTLSRKLAGKSEWTRPQIEKSAILLGLTPDDIIHYFF